MLATTELLDGNTNEFIKIATEANQSFSDTYEVLPFLLALYYNAEGDREMAAQKPAKKEILTKIKQVTYS